MRVFIASLSVIVASLALQGCSSYAPARLKEDGQYWQRTEASSALWLRGPKAQQTLNLDIARCVTEIKELQKLDAIREVVPADSVSYHDSPDPDTSAGKLAKWETPERDGYLRAEHLPYHDLETCMTSKGWERVEHLPYDIAEEARDIYIENVTGQRRRVGGTAIEPREIKRKKTMRGHGAENFND